MQAVRQHNLARVQLGLVGNVALRRQRQPDGRLGRVLLVVIGEQALLGRRVLRRLLGRLFDVRKQGLGGFEGLRQMVSRAALM